MQDFIRPDCETIWTDEFFEKLRQFVSLADGKYVVVSLGWNKLDNLSCNFNDVFDKCTENTQYMVESITKTAKAIQVRDPELSNGLANRFKETNIRFLEDGCPSLLSERLNAKLLAKRISDIKYYGSKRNILVGGVLVQEILEVLKDQFI